MIMIEGDGGFMPESPKQLGPPSIVSKFSGSALLSALWIFFDSFPVYLLKFPFDFWTKNFVELRSTVLFLPIQNCFSRLFKSDSFTSEMKGRKMRFKFVNLHG